MESSTVMMRASACYYSASKKNNSMNFRKNNSCCFSGSRRKLEIGFYDKAQMDYYSSSSSCFRNNKLVIKGKEREEKRKEKTIKKREKLLKGLSKDLSALSQMMMSFDLDSELGDQQIKPSTVSEAAELLLGHLEKLRAEEKELKRKKKEEEALSKTSKRLEEDMSSSSSSESSDSECEEEVVDMDLLKRVESTANQPDVQDEKTAASSLAPPQSVKSLLQPHPLTSQPLVRPDISTDVVPNSNSSGTSNCCKEISRACLDSGNKSAVGISEKKIEVCMGGKCKKSGSTSLLEELQKAVGVDVPVLGCKCMGKCREGPNVRVVNHNNAQDPARILSSPLCIGVGLEDVNLIVANFLGENQNGVGLATAP